MNAKSGKPEQVEDIEAIAERAERGEDISAHFTQQYRAKQRVNIDFPLALLRDIDAECERIGVTRQARSLTASAGARTAVFRVEAITDRPKDLRLAARSRW